MQTETKERVFYPWNIQGLELWKETNKDKICILGEVKRQYKNTGKFVTKIYYQEL